MTTVVIPDNGKLDDLKETLSKSGVEIKDVNPKSLGKSSALICVRYLTNLSLLIVSQTFYCHNC